MVRTVLEYNCETAKLTGVKAAITRHCTTLDNYCISLEKLKTRPQEEIRNTAKKKAQEINNTRDLIESKQDELILSRS